MQTDSQAAWAFVLNVLNVLAVPAFLFFFQYLRTMKSDLVRDVAAVKDDVAAVHGTVDTIDTRLTTVTMALAGHEKLDELRHMGEQRERDLLVDRAVENTRRIERLEDVRRIPS